MIYLHDCPGRCRIEAAFHGSRGANGVIIITTKQGQQDSKATVKVKASLGGSNRAVRDYDRVSTNQYFELYWEALRNQYAKSGGRVIILPHRCCPIMGF